MLFSNINLLALILFLHLFQDILNCDFGDLIFLAFLFGLDLKVLGKC